MTTRPIALFVWLTCLTALGQSASRAADEAGPTLLPAPLDAVALDPGPLARDFEVVKVEFFGPGEFTVPPNRVVAEDSLVFTLRAKANVARADMNTLLAGPFPRVRFVKQEDGQPASADARPQGYGLFHDGRWLSAKRGRDLRAGESFQVWTHLGKGGAAALNERRPAKAVFEKPAEAAKEP